MNDVTAVSGAAGFIGAAVVRALLASGRTVRALVEPGGDTANLKGLSGDINRVQVDVCDGEGMARALSGCSAFYHLAAIYQLWTPDPTALYRVNVEGTTASLLAARRAGVGRVIYTSSIAAVGLVDGGVADENTAFNLWDIANPYILSKYLSEQVALRFAADGQDIVVVNPAFPFGAGDVGPTPTGNMILSVLCGQVPGASAGGFCAVDVDDVAAGHLGAETLGKTGRRYILGNHNVSYRAFLDEVSAVAGAKSPRLSIPSWVGRGAAFGMEAWAKRSGTTPMATLKSVQYLQRNAFFSSARAQDELGFPCTPLPESIEKAVRYFRDHGKA